LSFLDPILLVSLFPRHKTVVKSTFFGYPFFSWVLKVSGYLPSSPGEEHVEHMIRNLETLQDFLSSGGNLFIFPEGTRSRNGKLGPFEKGAFTIARNCHAPIQVIRIRNSHHFFPTGTLLFNATDKIRVTVERIGTLTPESIDKAGSLSKLIETARACYQAQEQQSAENREPAP